MPENRTLPIAAAHREFTVKAGGEMVPREFQLVGVTVTNSANKVATARLVYVDGAAATGKFPLGESDLFAPGQRVEILAGSSADSTSMFVGTVVRVGLRVRESATAQWVVDCRHAVMKLTVTPRSADFFDQTDSEIIGTVLDAAGVDADVEVTSTQHKQMLQYHATDWDFLLARARANGQIAWCEGEKVVVRRPAMSGATVCTLQFGTTLLEFEGEVDARRQHPAIHGTTWNPADQAEVAVDASTPGFTAPGDLNSDELAAVAGAGAGLQLRHPALPEAEAQAWVDGAALTRRVDQVCGRGKCVGIATVRTGSVVELAGLGARFNGKVFVTGVRHEFSLVQGWKTHVQFGGIEADSLPAAGERAEAAGLLPSVSGLQIGIVTSNEDPDGEHRVRVRLPMLGLSSDGIWARVASLDAGDDRGFFFRPEIGDEVTVGFLGEDPRHPVILGMLHSSAKAAPLQGADDNHVKLYKSRSGMLVQFDDEKVVMTLSTPAGSQIVLDEEAQSLTLADQKGNKLLMDSSGIHFESVQAFEVKSTTVSIEASAELKLEGSASAELKGGGTTKVSGAVVHIN